MVTIGIIGGTGVMGQWFKDFFEGNGVSVLIAGRKTELTPEQLCEKSDLVIISVPIPATEEVIKKYAPLVKEAGCVTDFTSLKAMPMEAMESSVKGEYFGMHPVFGPGEKGIEGRVVVLCKGKGSKWFDWMKDLLER